MPNVTNHPNRKGLDRDRLFMLPRDATITNAHEALRHINRLEGEEMVAALSVLFAAIVSRTGINPREAWELGQRMLRHEEHHDKANIQLQSLRDFAAIQGLGLDVDMGDGKGVVIG